MKRYEIILIRKKDNIIIRNARFFTLLYYKIYAKLNNYDIYTEQIL